MNKKVAIIGAVDFGRTTANMIEANKGIEINPAFAPESIPYKNYHSFDPIGDIFIPRTDQKKFRKHNNRKHNKRRK